MLGTHVLARCIARESRLEREKGEHGALCKETQLPDAGLCGEGGKARTGNRSASFCACAHALSLLASACVCSPSLALPLLPVERASVPARKCIPSRPACTNDQVWLSQHWHEILGRNPRRREEQPAGLRGGHTF
eukprot:6181538-Pleurochrysis_carterae.AAC.1